VIEEKEFLCIYKNYIYRGKNWKYPICNADNSYCRYYYYTLCKEIYPKNQAYKIRLSQQCKCLEFSDSNSEEEEDAY